MSANQHYSVPTRRVAELLGLEIARSRIARRWTVADLAERVGVTSATVRSVERGALSVKMGTVLELASVVGLDLLGGPADVEDRIDRARDRLALLPSRVRDGGEARDDF